MRKWFGRKFLIMILTAVLTPVFLRFGVPPEVVGKLILSVAGYILGQSAVDAAAAYRGTAAAAAIAQSCTPGEVCELERGVVPPTLKKGK